MGEINPLLVNGAGLPNMTETGAFIKSPDPFAATNFTDVVVIPGNVILPKLCVGARLAEVN